ncbi:MAG: hypothetical protein JO146_07680, partial [Candidatus Eremiobacteraeota bacterium]|nr:hypothetical protein [Candidatus Eremiobacteraeota bacterium]
GPGYDWPAGYDKNGNLFVECSYASPCSNPSLAELSGGTWHLLNLDTPINFPGAVQLMGATLGVADQAGGPDGMTLDYTKVSGSSAHDVKKVSFGTASCYAGWASSWGSLSKNPDGLQKKKIDKIATPNSNCGDDVSIWDAQNGGAPITSLNPPGVFSPAGVTFTK